MDLLFLLARLCQNNAADLKMAWTVASGRQVTVLYHRN